MLQFIPAIAMYKLFLWRYVSQSQINRECSYQSSVIAMYELFLWKYASQSQKYREFSYQSPVIVMYKLPSWKYASQSQIDSYLGSDWKVPWGLF